MCVLVHTTDNKYINHVFFMLPHIILDMLQHEIQIFDLQQEVFPFWDSIMLIVSIVAMIFVTLKYVENWLLWWIIEVFSVMFYIIQGVYAILLQYTILTALAIIGVYSWILRSKH